MQFHGAMGQQVFVAQHCVPLDESSLNAPMWVYLSGNTLFSSINSTTLILERPQGGRIPRRCAILFWYGHNDGTMQRSHHHHHILPL